MIKVKNINGNPDIPEHLKEHVVGYVYNHLEDNFTLKLSEEYKQLSVIRAAQGKAQLSKLGVYSTVKNMIESSDDELIKIFWEYDPHWNMESPTVKHFAEELNIDLQEFFKNARDIII